MMNIYDVLNELNINYEEVEHKQVFSAEESQHIKNLIKGIGCKNLFLKDKENKYYLCLISDEKKANLKELAKLVDKKHFTFATEVELKNILNLSIGSVTPLGIINDKENKVKLLIDKDLENNKILMHSNVNTKTLSMEYKDLIKFIDYFKHKYVIF